MTAPYPPFDGLTVDALKQRIGAPSYNASDEAWMADCVAWVRVFAGRMQAVNGLSDEATLFAAVMHGWKVYSRRGSITGVQSFDIGVAVYVAQHDADLRDAYRSNMPRVG